jgi:choline kinase
MASDKRLTTALLLAAGTGSRLQPLTLDAPKCLTEVGGKTILGRLLDNLRAQQIERLVVVTGHLEHCIREYLDEYATDIKVEYVFNRLYKTTNNIYSLWLAKELIEEQFILLESDLVFEESMLSDLMIPDKIAVSRILPWMNGTTVKIDSKSIVSKIHVKKKVEDVDQYKTVNICSLSSHSWNNVVSYLKDYIENGDVNEYYESAFSKMVADGVLKFGATIFDENRWYEIDNIDDLANAEMMFPRD